MSWKVNINNKEVDASECPHIWRSPIEQICTHPDNYKNFSGDFICKRKKDCPIVI